MPDAPHNNSQHLQPVEAPIRQLPLAIQDAKKRSLAIFSDLRRCQIRIKMGRHLVPFAILLLIELSANSSRHSGITRSVCGGGAPPLSY